ncbi:MAG: (2Fe-2S)-binding protein [Planctomycetes bacterium]|nr:(2Fe-2S)-binding protein [Planctomycetota bacterium]MBU4399056.1 (2Fe-2S)-binding protein [Planctomycetota bacterium]MCG2684311.1 2Fe-2S iron-sulfur cluster-binding protein [Planctomycetales bacterium]
MATIIIDNREIEIPAGRRLNGIEAARLVGVEIPHYCWHPGLSVAGSCRMCLVEVGTRDPKTGEIAMQPKLVPACNTIVADNMVIVTNSEKVARARAMVEEDLLLRHPIDCPICDKAGECLLQDYHFEYGQPERRADIRPFTSRRRDLGDVTLFVDRCVMCSRCVRFAREISGTCELMITGRGAREEIDVVAGFPLNNKLSGNVVDLCPVGALGDKDFLYRQRVWYLRRHRGVCTGCSTGCSIWIEENQDRVWRIKPRENPFVNKWWICNDGRYDYPHVHDPRRLTQPWGRETGITDTRDWIDLPKELNRSLGEAGRLAAVISPFLTVEEAYLLCKLIRGIDAEAPLVIGPVPEVGEEERFPGGFTIRAEKCPNRRGVEAVIAHFARRVATFDELLTELDQDALQGVWVSGGYKHEWIGQATAARFERLKLLVVQDLFPSPLSERATYLLPGAAYPERDGSYVNHADRLQSVRRAIRPPAGVRTEGSVCWELLGRKGLYNARAALDEIAREILYFSVAADTAPETGIDLKANLLAG